MVLFSAFILPLLIALLCLALNRVVATRLLGYAAAAALLASALLLAVAGGRNELALFERLWMGVENQTFSVSLAFDQASLPFAVLVAAGGAVCMLALALALPARLREFGGLIAVLLVLLVATLVGLALREAVMLPLIWAALPILSFVARRASGGQADSQALPVGLLGNLFGALMLLGAALSTQFREAGAAVPDVALVGLLVAALLALGLPPFHRAFHDIADAPANVAAPILAFGLSLVAGFTLLRFAAQTPLPEGGRLALQIIGLAAVVICGAGALGEHRLRRLIGWQTSAQFGLLLVAGGQTPLALATIAPAMLVNIALVACTGLLAVGLIERRAGSDDLRQIQLRAPLLLPATALLIAAASAIGVPGTWGFWPLRWLFDELRTSNPLLIGPLLAGATLLALAWLVPLAAFLRAPEQPEPSSTTPWAAALCPLLAALPLVVFGIGPALAWNGWGAGIRLALLPLTPTTLNDPSLPGLVGQIGGALGLVALLTFVLWLRTRSTRHTLADSELPGAPVMTPDGLGESLRGLATLGAPSSVFNWLWQGMIAASRGAAWALSFFEQRFFMAGLMIAVIAVILLLMQGQG